MVDMMTINAAVQSGTALWKIVAASKQLIENSELVTAVSEVNTKLMAAQGVALNAQQEQAALADQVRELKEKIVELENWKREEERYTLTEITPGIPAYLLQSEIERGTTTHRLCANCFDSRQKKSHLQFGPQGAQGRVTCSQCRGEWFPGGGRPSTVRLVRT